MAKFSVLDKGRQQGSDAAGLMALTFCAPCLFPCHCHCLYHAALHASQAGGFSFFDVRAGERRSSFLPFHRPFWHYSLGRGANVKMGKGGFAFRRKKQYICPSKAGSRTQRAASCFFRSCLRAKLSGTWSKLQSTWFYLRPGWSKLVGT